MPWRTQGTVDRASAGRITYTSRDRDGHSRSALDSLPCRAALLAGGKCMTAPMHRAINRQDPAKIGQPPESKPSSSLCSRAERHWKARREQSRAHRRNLPPSDYSSRPETDFIARSALPADRVSVVPVRPRRPPQLTPIAMGQCWTNAGSGGGSAVARPTGREGEREEGVSPARHQ